VASSIRARRLNTRSQATTPDGAATGSTSHTSDSLLISGSTSRPLVQTSQATSRLVSIAANQRPKPDRAQIPAAAFDGDDDEIAYRVARRLPDAGAVPDRERAGDRDKRDDARTEDHQRRVGPQPDQHHGDRDPHDRHQDLERHPSDEPAAAAHRNPAGIGHRSEPLGILLISAPDCPPRFELAVLHRHNDTPSASRNACRARVRRTATAFSRMPNTLPISACDKSSSASVSTWRCCRSGSVESTGTTSVYQRSRRASRCASSIATPKKGNSLLLVHFTDQRWLALVLEVRRFGGSRSPLPLLFPPEQHH
jgi:hypothetical protein